MYLVGYILYHYIGVHCRNIIQNFLWLFFPNIWVGRRNKSHGVWLWLFGNWRFVPPACFESVTNRHKSNTELNHTPNTVKPWSSCVIEINLHFLWLGILFIKGKMLLFYTKVYVLLGFVFWQLFIPHIQNLRFSSLSRLSSTQLKTYHDGGSGD